MTFNFRLQRVLELREAHEKAKARELATAQEAVDAAKRIQEALALVRATSRAEIDTARHDAPRVGYLHGLNLALQSLDSRIDSATQSVKHSEDAMHVAQSALTDAARDRRMLDRLKERHALQWRAEEAHRDRVGMDEIALMRFARAANNHGDTPSSDTMTDDHDSSQ